VKSLFFFQIDQDCDSMSHNLKCDIRLQCKDTLCKDIIIRTKILIITIKL